jgi:hypothetical protein
MAINYTDTNESWLPDSALAELNTFPVSDFQMAIKLNLPRNHIGRDFWNSVIHDASCRLIGGITPDQRPHLRNWIQNNWYWFTEGWSDRAKYQLTHRLAELGSKENT